MAEFYEQGKIAARLQLCVSEILPHLRVRNGFRRWIFDGNELGKEV